MSNNKELDNYSKKYHKNNHTLLKYSKKEVEEFNKKNKSDKDSLLKGKKWKLIGDTYYEIPKVLFLTWFRNLHKGWKIASCVILGGLVTAITVPTVLAIENSKNRHIVKDITYYATIYGKYDIKGHFFSKNPYVFYIPVIDYNEYVPDSYMRVLDVSEDCVELKNLISCNPNKKATLNMKTGELYYESYSFFTDVYGLSGRSLPHQEIFYTPSLCQDAGSKILKEGHPFFINLNDYNLQPIKNDGVYYLPLDLMMLLDPTIEPSTAFCSDNNEVQLMSSSIPLAVKAPENYPSSFYKWFYDLFTFNVDLQFGLTGYRRYQRNNDSYFTYNKDGARKTFEPYREKLINSKTTLEFDVNFDKMFGEQLDDGAHSRIFSPSFATDSDKLPSDFAMPAETKLTLDKIDDEIARREKAPKSEKMDENVCTFEDGSIGYLCFDSFDVDGLEALVKANKEFNAKVKEGSKIKDVVIDIAHNGGGTVGVEGALLSWICDGVGTQILKDARDESIIKSSYRYNIYNEDSILDEKDYLPKDVNIYIITDATFSAACAFTFDTYMYTLSDAYKTSGKNIKFIGKPHLGGACSVTGTMVAPTGMHYRFSSTAVGVNWNNYSITCDEKGYIDSGWELTDEQILDRTGTINPKIIKARGE